MFLRGTIRKKNGKEHRYWSIVENKRIAGGKVRQRHVLYLGEINAAQFRRSRALVPLDPEQSFPDPSRAERVGTVECSGWASQLLGSYPQGRTGRPRSQQEGPVRAAE